MVALVTRAYNISIFSLQNGNTRALVLKYNIYSSNLYVMSQQLSMKYEMKALNSFDLLYLVIINFSYLS